MCDLYSFDCGLVVHSRRAGLSISEIAAVLGISHTAVPSVYTESNQILSLSLSRQNSVLH